VVPDATEVPSLVHVTVPVAVAVNATAAVLVLAHAVFPVALMLIEGAGATVTFAVPVVEQPAPLLATTVTAWVCVEVVGGYVKVAHPGVEVAVAKVVLPSENTYEVAPLTEAQIVVSPAQFGPFTDGLNVGSGVALSVVVTVLVQVASSLTMAVYVVSDVVVTVKSAEAVLVAVWPVLTNENA
jgi:hypothetical protein